MICNETIERVMSCAEVIEDLGLDDECSASSEYAFERWDMIADEQMLAIRLAGEEMDLPPDCSFSVGADGILCLTHGGTATLFYIQPMCEIIARAYRVTDDSQFPRLAAA